MGLLRILLAVSVFCAHAGPIWHLPWLNGDLAVEVFFVISGFYMQLILTTKYTRKRLGPGWVWRFYQARYLRLFPAYAAGCILALGIALIWREQPPIPIWTYVKGMANTPGNVLFKVFLGLTNVSMIGQDLIMFLVSRQGQVHWSSNFGHSDQLLFRGLLIPQAWSLGVELSFYVVAPLVLCWRSRWLAPLAICALGAKLLVIHMFDLGDPWTYRFFPFELGNFLLGALAYRDRERLERLIPQRFGAWCAYLLAIVLTTMARSGLWATFLYPLIVACILPSVFRATGTWKWDRMMGELSYPFYIFHFFVLALVWPIQPRLWPHLPAAWSSLALTFLLSGGALLLEEKYLEPWRSKFGRQSPAPIRSKVQRAS